MGCWGHGPFDNDAVCDMVAGLAKKVHAVVEAKTDIVARRDYGEARAVVQFMLVAHGTDILGGPGLDDPLKALARMRSDVEWLGGFRQPKKLAKMIENEMAAILRRMADCKGCRRADKDDKDELNAIVAKAHATTVPRSSWPIAAGRFRRHRRKRTGASGAPSKRKPTGKKRQ